MFASSHTEKWTRNEIIDALTKVARSRLGMSLDEFVEAVRTDKLDICEYAEMVALLNMLAKDDVIFSKAA